MKGGKQKLIIKGRLPGMNELINANRISKWAGSLQKKEETRRVKEAAENQLIRVDEKNRLRDYLVL